MMWHICVCVCVCVCVCWEKGDICMHGGKESTLNQRNYAQPYRQLKSSLFTSACMVLYYHEDYITFPHFGWCPRSKVDQSRLPTVSNGYLDDGYNWTHWNRTYIIITRSRQGLRLILQTLHTSSPSLVFLCCLFVLL